MDTLLLYSIVISDRSGSVLEGFQTLRPHVARIAPVRTDRDLVSQEQGQKIFIGRIAIQKIAAFVNGNNQGTVP